MNLASASVLTIQAEQAVDGRPNRPARILGIEYRIDDLARIFAGCPLVDRAAERHPPIRLKALEGLRLGELQFDVPLLI